jgi:hypothetical protein
MEEASILIPQINPFGFVALPPIYSLGFKEV